MASEQSGTSLIFKVLGGSVLIFLVLLFHTFVILSVKFVLWAYGLVERINMYYQSVRGKATVGFEKKIKRDHFTVIVKAAKNKLRVKIRYKKIDGTTVSRNIAPYSENNGYLYASTKENKDKHCKSFLLNSILSAKQLDETFTPKWKVEL